jgi:hypothetical protein
LIAANPVDCPRVETRIAHSIREEVDHANPRQRPVFFEPMSKRRKGFPSETHVKRGHRIVHGDKELVEKLGRNDLCPCGSGRRFAKCCRNGGGFRRGQSRSLLSGSDSSSTVGRTNGSLAGGIDFRIDRRLQVSLSARPVQKRIPTRIVQQDTVSTKQSDDFRAIPAVSCAG